MSADISIDVNGELIVTPGGDLFLVYDDEALAQNILFRLKTTLGDCLVAPELGADLEQFIGEPNTLQTQQSIQDAVFNALTFDDLTTNPTIDVVPAGQTGVLISVTFTGINSDVAYQILAGLDLKQGLVYSRIHVLNQ